jgi:tetrahydromethanopterin S-methyltransferase subunit F
MNLNRRAFATSIAKAAVTIAAAGSFLGVASCGNIFAAIEKYVPVGLQGFTAVVNLLAGAGVLPLGTGTAVQLLITAVKAAFADVTVAVQDYQAAPAADKATLLGKISTVVADAETNIQLFWSNLNLPAGSTATLVEGLLQVIVSTLMGFGTQLPAPASSKEMRAKRSAIPDTKLINATPKMRSVAQFKADFNRQLPAEQKAYAIK